MTNTYVRKFVLDASGNLFAGTNGGVYLSTNNGTSWAKASSSLMTTYVLSLAVDAPGNLFAGTCGDGIFLSTNEGIDWTTVNNGLTATNVSSLAVSATNLFAGTPSRGVFRSTDNGNNWSQIDTGLTTTYVQSLAINSNGYVFAGTQGGGVFRSAQVTTAIDEVVGAIPKSYILSQNYPNPFNPSTVIRYRLPVQSHVALKVFNVLGQEATTLVDELQGPGYKSVVWNARNATSGIYFYRLQASGFSQTRKLILLR